MEHVLATLFEVPSEAYQAFVELKAFPQNDDTRIAQAALVKKENGVITPVDAFDPLQKVGDDTITGTLIGSVLGILGGPLGMLFGAGIGAWVGSTGSTDQALAQATLVETVAAKLNDGAAGSVLRPVQVAGGALGRIHHPAADGGRTGGAG